jgi:hypothetical protein
MVYAKARESLQTTQVYYSGDHRASPPYWNRQAYAHAREPAPILNLEADNRLVRHVRRDPKQNSAQISESAGVSPSTVERILKKKGYLRASCRRKPILSAKKVKDRLLWASKYEGMDWTRVIFTDEAAFEVEHDLKKEHCWRKPNVEWDEKNLSLRKKKGKMLHVWRAIIHGHKFPLVRFAL